MTKKTFITLLVALVITVATYNVYAFGPGWGGGPCGGFGPGSCANVNQDAQTAPMTQEQIDKFNKFQKESLPLRQKMMQLKTDLSILNSQQKPDYKAIADKQKEMIDVRTEIQKKAAEAGVTGFTGRGCGRGCGGNCAGTGQMGFGGGPRGQGRGLNF